MTMVHFRLADPSGIPLDGYVSLVPTRRVTVGDEIRLPTAVRVRLESGEATVDMLPSTTQWVWRVAELVKGGITRYVAVPDTEGTVEYAGLESVDPASLDVSSASVPAWEIATRTAQEMLDKVGEIDGKVERAEDAAAGAESSAGEAESHEHAARSSADSAASSARDAASNATAAASSAGSAASSASVAASSAVEAAESVSTAASHATAAAQSATAAAKSVAEAASSASAAASSAEQAANVVASVSGSVTQAETAARSASQSSTAAAGSASAAGGSAQAAADSASKAGESATAAKASETNAASSASAAKISETNAAASATAAQQAVDGFGLTVGSVTTGEPGTDASVGITKTGTKYTADFTIPRGMPGADGVNENVPLGSTSGVVAQASDAYSALPRKVRVHGRTIENLWPEMNVSRDGITVSVDSGVINVTGTASARVAIPSVVGSLSPGGKVTISVNKTDSNVAFDLYAYNSGSYVSGIVGVKGTASASGEVPADGFDEIRAYTIVEQGVTVNWSGMVMLVEGDTVPDVFVPSGVHTVEPTKLIYTSKNIISPFKESMWNGITVSPSSDGGFTLKGTSAGSDRVYYTARIPIPAGVKHVYAYIDKAPQFVSQNGSLIAFQVIQHNANNQQVSFGNVSSGRLVKIVDTARFVFFQIYAAGQVQCVENVVYHPQIEFSDSFNGFSKPEEIQEIELPEDISLTDGDTLTIDRDGMTRIVHAEGEPTVLENVTLPELPAPTFNVYTTGGYVPPTVDVDYEQDVNLVLQALEAKIASLEVNQTIMQQGA